MKHSVEMVFWWLVLSLFGLGIIWAAWVILSAIVRDA